MARCAGPGAGGREVPQGVPGRHPRHQRAQCGRRAASNQILFYTDGDAKQPTLFGNFRVAAGGKKLYDALAATGRVATQGIYFDTGSDRIRPESSPTLKEIGTMLKEHPDLKLAIEGHTDNVGAAAANQALSEKRAAAVRQALVDTLPGGRAPPAGQGARPDQAGRAERHAGGPAEQPAGRARQAVGASDRGPGDARCHR